MILLSLLLAACGIPAATPEEGWKRYDRPEARFTISLPEEWIEVSESSEKRDEVVNNVRKVNSGLADALEGNIVRSSGADYKLLAYDLSDGALATNFLPRIAVVQLQVNSGRLEQYVRAEIDYVYKELTDFLVSTVDLENVELATGTAFSVKYKLQGAYYEEYVTYEVTQYYLLLKRDVQNRDFYVISMATNEGQVEKYAETFRKIAESFRWLP